MLVDPRRGLFSACEMGWNLEKEQPQSAPIVAQQFKNEGRGHNAGKIMDDELDGRVVSGRQGSPFSKLVLSLKLSEPPMLERILL